MTKLMFFIIGLFFLTNCTTKKETFDRKEDEPLFADIDSEELEYKKTVEKAQGQLSQFVQKLKVKPETSTACVKIPVTDIHGKTAFIWLINPVINSDTCVAEVFETPKEFDLKLGDQLNFIRNDIQDWYILDKEGRMDGGYSLRYIRQRLSVKEQIEFDKYIGVKIYL